MTDRNDAPDDEGGQAAPSVDEALKYGDVHKLVLQGLMAAGYLDNKGVKRLFTASCSYLNRDPEEMTKMSFVQKVVRMINEKIKRFDMAIRSASCELTGKKYYVFLLTVERPIVKLQTYYTKFQIELFQIVMHAILTKYNNFSVPLTECVNLALKTDTKGNLESAEQFILKMVDQNYFTRLTPSTKDDFNVTLGFRGIREFEPFLRDAFSDVISNCCFCKQILLHAYFCSNCGVSVHRPCYAKLQPGMRQCPNCSTSWEDPSTMKPRMRNSKSRQELEGDDDEPRPGPSRATSGTNRTTLKLNLEDLDTEPIDINFAFGSDAEGQEEDEIQDIEGETDGVVTRGSDNNNSSDEDLNNMPDFEFNPPPVQEKRGRGRPRRGRVVSDSDSD